MSDDESGGGVDTLADDGEPDRGTFYTRVPRAGEPPEDTLSPRDRGAAIPRLTSGHSWDAHRKHPPLPCPAPRIQATYRGYYRCPACGEKVRIVGYRTCTEWGYDASDTFWGIVGPAVAQAAYIGADLLRCIVLAVWWVCCKIVRKRSVAEEITEESGDYYAIRVPAAAVMALAMLAKVAANQQGETNANVERAGKTPRPRKAEESTKSDPQEVEKASAET